MSESINDSKGSWDEVINNRECGVISEWVPISEQYRLAAEDWVDLDAAADLLEQSKSAMLAQEMQIYADLPVSRAENLVKSSKHWMDYIESMTTARKKANLARVQVEYLRMKFSEWQSHEANKRAEMRL